MTRYIIKRILWIIPVMIGVITIAFALNLMTPGDPVTTILGSDASEEAKIQLAEELGLDEPAGVRYVKYIWNFFTKLDLGISYSNREPVREEIFSRFPKTMTLALGSIALAILIGIPIGVISAVKQYSWVDNLSMGGSMFFVSVPNFWLSLMLMLLFAVKLKWLPPANVTNPLGWILPIAVMAVGSAANIARITRSSMLESTRQDYVDTAKAKGLSGAQVVFRHCIRNALIPVVTAIGNQIGVQLGGALAIETVFAIPGIGTYLVSSIAARNYSAVQGSVVFLALVFSIVNLLVDILYTFIDPRLKETFKAEGKMKRNRLAIKKAQQSEEGGAA